MKNDTRRYDLRIDGPEFRVQRELLQRLISMYSIELVSDTPQKTLTPAEVVTLTGLQNLCDAIADIAHDDHDIDCLLQESMTVHAECGDCCGCGNTGNEDRKYKPRFWIKIVGIDLGLTHVKAYGMAFDVDPRCGYGKSEVNAAIHELKGLERSSIESRVQPLVELDGMEFEAAYDVATKNSINSEWRPGHGHQRK